MTPDPDPRPASPGRNLARVAAVLVALSVLTWFVVDAQTRANRRAEQQPSEPEANPVAQPDSDPDNDRDRTVDALLNEANIVELPPVLNSSKSLVIDQESFLRSSKFGPIEFEGETVEPALPSTKGMVLDPDMFLHSSKSRAPILSPPQPKPNQVTPGMTPPPGTPQVSPDTFMFSSKSAAPIIQDPPPNMRAAIEAAQKAAREQATSRPTSSPLPPTPVGPVPGPRQRRN